MSVAPVVLKLCRHVREIAPGVLKHCQAVPVIGQESAIDRVVPKHCPVVREIDPVLAIAPVVLKRCRDVPVIGQESVTAQESATVPSRFLHVPVWEIVRIG